MEHRCEETIERLRRLEARMRRQQKILLGAVLVAGGVAMGALQQNDPAPRFTRLDAEQIVAAEIRVERIDVVEPDGRLALVLANKPRLPDPIIDGREVATGRTGPGMLFFNGKGDECGGLTYGSREDAGRPHAGAHFAFDQYQNDQVVFLSYQDDGHRRSSGLHVVDRPASPTIAELLSQKDAMARAAGDERARLLKAWQESAARGEHGAARVFVGSANGEAMLLLKDTRGRDRIRLKVDDGGDAWIEILDDKEEVVCRIPD